MSQVFDEIWAEGYKEGVGQGYKIGLELVQLANVRKVMEKTGWTAEHSLDMLGVPEADRARYLAKLSV